MATCNFCKRTIPKGTGKMYVFKTGKLLNFCSSKCEKNTIKLGRKAVFFKWTGHYEKGTKKTEEKQ